jgi:hypothetical protein
MTPRSFQRCPTCTGYRREHGPCPRCDYARQLPLRPSPAVEIRARVAAMSDVEVIEMWTRLEAG